MVYIGRGAGMAPLRSHLSYLFDTEKNKGKVSFWYGAHSADDIYYTGYFKKLEAENDNFTLHSAVSHVREHDNWNGNVGYIHEVVLAQYLSAHKNPREIDYYLCGPPAMIKATLNMLKNLGVDEKMISFDEF